MAERRQRAGQGAPRPDDGKAADRPNPGDPGPEQPAEKRPVDPAEDPRLPPQEEIPRGV
jgi:hypothetical protein